MIVKYGVSFISSMYDPLSTFNSLAPERPGCHFKTAIFHLVLLISIFTSSNDNVLRWMPWDLTDGKSTLIQVMAWCCQATSHYLSQCWPYGVTRPQWVKIAALYPIHCFNETLWRKTDFSSFMYLSILTQISVDLAWGTNILCCKS